MSEDNATLLVELINKTAENKFNELSRSSQVLTMKVATVSEYDASTESAKVYFPNDLINTSSWYLNRSGAPLEIGQKVYIYHKYGDVEQGFISVSGDNNLSQQGYTGSRGLQGYTGSVGYVGSAGAGYTGSQGIIGYTGSQGIQGIIGYTGSQGIQGIIGYTGSQGVGYTGSASTVIGYTGSRGYTGSQGIQGVIGYTGSASTVVGYTGSQGVIGYTGSASTVVGYTGSQGIQGIIGYTGSKGYTGSASTVIGYTGSLGYTGSAGAGYTGSQGIQGYTGSAPGLSNIATLPTTGWVVNTGDYAYKYDMPIANIISDHIVDIIIDKDYLDIASTMGLSTTVESYNNGITFYAQTSPTVEIPFTWMVSILNTDVSTLGYTGSIGYTGSASTVIGYTGSVGFVGSRGYTGSASTVIGYTGSQGYTGSRGYTGSTVLYLSAGVSSQPTYVDNLNGSVTIGNATVRLYNNANFTGALAEYTLTGGTFVLTDLTESYLVGDYNGGSPIMKVITNIDLITESSIVPILSLYRDGLEVHSLDWDDLGLGLSNKIHQRLVKTDRFALESGLILGETPTRVITITAGKIWYGAVMQPLTAINTSTDRCTLYYHNGGVNSKLLITQYNNSQYEDGTNLVTSQANRYLVNWVYRGIEDSNHTAVVLGISDYVQLSQAIASQPRTDIPDILKKNYALVGRIIVKYLDNTATQIDSAFANQFTTTGIYDHNNLNGLQGGVASEYYHLSSAEYASLPNKLDKSTWELINRFGFTNRNETTISFDGTNTFTLARTGASFSYFRSGKLCTITTNKSVILSATPPATTGKYFIYIDDEIGTLTASTVAWTLTDTKVPVAVLYWDNTQTPKYFLNEERHSCAIDRAMHRYEHETMGTQLISGGAVSGYVLDTVTDTDKTFGISQTEIADEDIFQTLTALADPNGITTPYEVLYRVGTAWKWQLSNMPFKYTTTGFIEYDNAGTMTPINASTFANTYLIASNIQGDGRFIIISGKQAFPNASSAYAEKISDLDLTNFVTGEFVALYQFTWDGQAGAGTGQCKLNRVARIEGNLISTTVIASVEHNGLSGIQGGATGEYFHLDALGYNKVQDIDNTIYTTTTATTEGWYRIATIPIGTQFKEVSFRIKGYTATGTVTEATIDINLGYYSGSYTSQQSSINANTSHSYNAQTNAENGWVLLYSRVSFDATSAYIDMYKYKTTAVTMETQPLTLTDWVWATGALTVNPTIGAYRNATVTMGAGFYGSNIVAASASSAGYSSYGVYGTNTLSNTTNKTGQWAYFGNIVIDYNSSYLRGRSSNTRCQLQELSYDGLLVPNTMDDFVVNIQLNMGYHADGTAFNTTIPTLDINIEGQTSLTENDICGLVYSTSTTQKVIRFYVKLKAANTVYNINPENRYGKSFATSSFAQTTSYIIFGYAGDQVPVAALPTPAQGSVSYANFRSINATKVNGIYLQDSSGLQWSTDGTNWNVALGYTGSRGTDGVIGYNGSTGYTGSVGYTGSQGIQGNIGYTGSQGIQGVIGYTGSASTVIGYTGSKGYTGSASTVIGYTGSQGTQGNIGYTGSASTAAGYTGSLGYTGSAGGGYTGSMGYTGSKGSTINGTSTIPTTGWVANGGDFAYYINIALVGILNTDVVNVIVDKDYLDSASACGLSGTVETYTSGITFYAKTVPTVAIPFTWTNVMTGTSVITGYTGSQGVVGYTGSRGATGYTGSQGVIGYTGSQGIQGIVGYTGSGTAADTLDGKHASDFLSDKKRTLSITDMNNANYGEPYVASTSDGASLGLPFTWAHLMYFRHQDGNGYCLQVAFNLDAGANPINRMMMRASSGTTWLAWSDVLTSKLYAELNTNSNTIGGTEYDNGSSGTAKTIDWRVGNHQKITMTGNCVFTFAAPTAPCMLSLRIINDGTAGRTKTFPTLKKAGGVAFVFTTTANAQDIMTLFYDGTSYHAQLMLDSK